MHPARASRFTSSDRLRVSLRFGLLPLFLSRATTVSAYSYTRVIVPRAAASAIPLSTAIPAVPPRARARSPDVAVEPSSEPSRERQRYRALTAHQMSTARPGSRRQCSFRRCVLPLTARRARPRNQPKSPNGFLGFEQQLRDVH